MRKDHHEGSAALILSGREVTADDRLDTEEIKES
jgi:hypothetical protein